MPIKINYLPLPSVVSLSSNCRFLETTLVLGDQVVLELLGVPAYGFLKSVGVPSSDLGVLTVLLNNIFFYFIQI